MAFYAAVDAALALALTAWLANLLGRPRGERPAPLVLLGWVFLFLLCARTLGWLTERRFLVSDEMPPGLPLSKTGATWLFCVITGAAGFACLRRGWQSALWGVLCALLFCSLGLCAHHWMLIAQAWRLMGSFWGSFLIWTLPFWLIGSCALLAAALLSPELSGYRGKIASLLVLGWLLSGVFFRYRLETRWDFGSRDLAQAAGLEQTGAPANVGILWLRPLREQPYVHEEKKAEMGSVDISQKNLVKIYDYLEARHYRSLFLKQAVRLLRRGWLFWWDAERALKAAALSTPGLVVPDYRLSTELLKGGPQTRDRFQALQTLSARAKPRKEGFEDVTQSQYIFEGFSGAFARFGDEDQARWWLVKIDNLWPIYEKKIEVTQVESTHDGEVNGTVMLSSSPAAGMLVGLFYVGASTEPANRVSSGTLSDSMPVDDQGRFRFTYLGPGRYYLGLMGAPEDLRGAVHESPGVFDVTQDTPVAHFPPIIVDREEPSGEKR